VVGDVDQSIYAFRGADFKNVAKFEHRFRVPPHPIFLLPNSGEF